MDVHPSLSASKYYYLEERTVNFANRPRSIHSDFIFRLSPKAACPYVNRLCIIISNYISIRITERLCYVNYGMHRETPIRFFFAPNFIKTLHMTT